MASNTPMILSKNSQAGVLEFMKQCDNMLGSQWNVREQMRQIDLTYIREKDYTLRNQKAKLANRYGDVDKLQNLQMPVVFPAVHAAVTYQSSVFLQGSPIFGCVADPAYEDAAFQIESIIDSQSVYGGWPRQIQLFFIDGFKYNMSALEVDWKEEVTYTVETDSTFQGGKQGKPKEVIWAGNCVEHWDMYNTIWDLRVPITEVSERGDFAANTKLMSKRELISYMNSLPNVSEVSKMEALATNGVSGAVNSSAAGSYYIPPIFQDALITPNLRGGTNWMSWAAAANAQLPNALKGASQLMYQVRKLYARIIPSELSITVPSANLPQIWKFIIVNNQTVIYAERQTNTHNLIPVVFGSPYEDGLSYQSKSLAQNITVVQEIETALMNSVIAGQRKAINDRVLYDPSRVGEAQINSDNPSAKIPVRPAAYGKPLSEAVYAFPYNNDNAMRVLEMLPNFDRIGQRITGQNPAREGQFVKGNKTQTEYSDVMNNSNGRDQNISILYEAQAMTPIKNILLANILQYQGPTAVYSRQKQQQVKVDPVKLRNAIVNFKMTDGLAPASKQLNSDVLQTAFQVIGSSPQVGANYNIGPLFSYLIKVQGGDIKDFEKTQEQVAYESAMNSWQSMAQLALSKGQPWNEPMPQPSQYNYLQPGQEPPPKPDALQTFQQTLEQQAAQNPATQQPLQANQPEVV